MKKKIIKFLIKILRYLLPAVIGWLEGDSHAVADAIASVLFLF